MIRKSITLVLLGLLAGATSLADEKKASTATALPAGDCTVLVQVTDSHERPIPDARVSLVGRSSSPSASKFQLVEMGDEQGQVRFAGLPRAHMTLSAEAHGKRATAKLDTTDACASTFPMAIPD